MSESIHLESKEELHPSHESSYHKAEKGHESLPHTEAQAQTEHLRVARQEAHEANNQSPESKALLNKINEQQQETAEAEIARQPASEDLRNTTFRKEIKHIRRKLKTTDKVGSKVIHQPIVRVFSEVSAKSITRPSGLLGGGLVAFLGSSIYLYYTKHIGLQYNYTVFFLFLVTGFIVGLILEAVVRLIRGRRSI